MFCFFPSILRNIKQLWILFIQHEVHLQVFRWMPLFCNLYWNQFKESCWRNKIKYKWMGSSIIKTSLHLCIWNKANWYLQICVSLDSILIPRLMCNYIWNYSWSRTAVYCNMTFYVHENHLKSRTQLFDFWEPEMILITFISGLLNNGKTQQLMVAIAEAFLPYWEMDMWKQKYASNEMLVL